MSSYLVTDFELGLGDTKMSLIWRESQKYLLEFAVNL